MIRKIKRIMIAKRLNKDMRLFTYEIQTIINADIIQD